MTTRSEIERLVDDFFWACNSFRGSANERAALMSAIDRVLAREAALRRLAPLCLEHGSGNGTRSGCPYCGLIEQHAALSRIDYLCGPPNDMEVSGYDVHCNENAVVEAVHHALAERDARIAELERLAYFYSPSEPFSPDGTTWKQHLEDRIAVLEKALRLLCAAHVEVCPSKESCATLIVARAALAPEQPHE